MKAAEQLIEPGPIHYRSTDARLQGQDFPADHHQMLVALGEVVVEKLCGERAIDRRA